MKSTHADEETSKEKDEHDKRNAEYFQSSAFMGRQLPPTFFFFFFFSYRDKVGLQSAVGIFDKEKRKSLWIKRSVREKKKKKKKSDKPFKIFLAILSWEKKREWYVYMYILI